MTMIKDVQVELMLDGYDGAEITDAVDAQVDHWFNLAYLVC